MPQSLTVIVAAIQYYAFKQCQHMLMVECAGQPYCSTQLQHTTAAHNCSTQLQHTTAAHNCSTQLQHTASHGSAADATP
jgi:hypothetical protein